MQLEGDPGADPEYGEEITYPIWGLNTVGSLRRRWEEIGKEDQWFLC